MSGSSNANFLQLINTNIGIAHKVCRIYFKEAEDREDVLQEMMYQLWRSFGSFDNKSKFSTWMYRVCLNTALTYRKRSNKNRAAAMSKEYDQIPDGPPEGNDESVTELYKAIAALAPVNKAIILLYLEELSYEEIAEITGLSKSNVSVKLVRIKRELENLLRNKLAP